MQLVRSPRTRAAVIFAAATAVVVVVTPSPAPAAVTVQNIRPGPGAGAPTLAPLTASSSSAAAAGTFVPPINGFQPFVVMGLTDENDGDQFYSPKAAQPGLLHRSPPDENDPPLVRSFNAVPGYIVGTLDSGGQATILSYADTQTVNLYANGLEGTYSIAVGGASGQEDLDVSDALGQYITGLGNASAGTSGPDVPQSSLKGIWNNSILTNSNEGSVIPTLVGNPIFAHWQVVMRNSQTQRLRVGADTYQGPQVELRATDTAHDNTFVRAAMSSTTAGGANSFPVFVFDFGGGSTEWSDNPQSPTTWNFMGVRTNVANNGNSITQSQFLFDTGAQVSVISHETANLLGINTGGSNPDPPDFTAQVLGIGGISTVNGYYIDNLSIVTDGVDLDAANVPVLVLDVADPLDGDGAVPGILGMNLFNDRDLIINAKAGNSTGGYLAFSEFALPQPKWTANAGGNWGDNANWYRGVPWQPGEVANFTASTAAPQTINVDANDGLGPYAMARINFDNANGYTLSGPGSLRLEELVGPAAIQVNSGSHTIGVPLQLGSTTNLTVIPAASTLTINNEITAVDGQGVTKQGQGTAEVKRLRNVGPVDVQAGKLKLLAGSGGAAGTSVVGTVAVAPAAQLDLTNNNLVITDAEAGTWDGTNYTGVLGLVRKGYNEGTWDGAGGITTSMPDAATGLTTLAVATAEQTGHAGGTFAGVSVDADDVLVMYTYGGDTNFDGKLDADDYGTIDFSVLLPQAVDGYYNGDFNFDGVVNADDYGVIDFNILAQTTPFPTGGAGAAAAAVTAVPEPAALGLTLLTVAAIGSRRRRRLS